MVKIHTMSSSESGTKDLDNTSSSVIADQCYYLKHGIVILILIAVLLIILCLSVHYIQFFNQSKNPNKYVVVKTSLGEIRGKEMAWEGEPNVSVNEFLGIPYAEDATQCLSFLEFNTQFVMLQYQLYNGSAWVSIGETIMVVINYRLGLFGFLDAQIKEAAGNQGIYDIFEALKWTYENIAAFGGDPELITLMGESAGSISIAMLSLYEPARRYFHRGIMMSGSIFMRNGNIPDLQQKLLKTISEEVCDAKYTDALTAIKCLLNIDPAQLNDHLNKNKLLGLAIFPDGGHPYSMFELPLLQIYKKDNIKPLTMLLGVAEHEGRFFLAALLASLLNLRLSKLFDLYTVQRDMYELFLNFANKMFLQFDDEFIKAVAVRYVPPDVQNGTKLVDGWSNLLGDIIINCPTRYYAEFAKKFNSNIYCYENAYLPDLNYFPNWMEATHASDLHFSFGVLSNGNNHSSLRDQKMNRIMIKTFAEFVKFGNMSDTKTWLVQDMSFGRCAFLDEPELGKTNGSLGSSDNCDFLKEAYFTPYITSSLT